MEPFEYITVLVSIILGLGVTQIITGLAHFMHGSNKVKIYWPHLLWIFMVFFLHVQEWWMFYEYKSMEKWKLIVFIFVMLYPIGLFIQARLLFPFDKFDEETDLKLFYYENYRLYFGLVAALASVSMIDNIVLRHMSFAEQGVQIGLIAICLSIAIFKVRTEWIHKLLSVLLLASMVVSLAVNWDEWMIK